MLKNILLFSLSLLSILGVAQKSTIRGNAQDELGQPLPGATIMLLHKSDSVLYKFSISNKDGEYSIFGIKEGDYLLQLSFVGYQSIFKPLSAKGGAKIDMPVIKLDKQSSKLGEFEIVDELIPMKMKDDTIEYNADAFKTQPEAVVKDLLRKLPGVEVESDGTIKAQGEEVKKILVDGKEFFGDDTKLATENLPADMVAKVQIFDEMSEASKMTGIDDGEREKYINLKIKKNRKKGMFGNVTAGGGIGTGLASDGLYNAKFNINKFKKNVQMSILGMGNNNNEQGFSYSEYVNFMGGGRNSSRGGGNMWRGTNGQGVPMGGNPNDGLTKTWAGGVNLNYDFGKNTSLMTNYFFNQNNKTLDRVVDRNYFSDKRDFASQESETQNNFGQSHRINIKYRQQIDSTQKITFTGRANYATAKYLNNSSISNFRDVGVISSSTTTDNNQTGDNLGYNGEIVYGKKSATQGRSLTLKGEFGNMIDNQDMMIDFLNTYGFSDTSLTLFSSQTVQNQILDNNQINYKGKIAYTEPVGKRKYIEIYGEHQNYTYNYDKQFFDIDPVSRTTSDFNQLLSIDYDNTFFYNRGGFNFKLNTGGANFIIGAAGQQSILNGTTANSDSIIKNELYSILPRLKFSQRFGGNNRFVMDYKTSVQQPTLEQLQPTLDNSDPLNLYIGNPDLKVEYRHNLRFRYMSFNEFSFTNLYTMLNATYTRNKITNQQTIDSTFAQMTTPTNVDDDYMISGYGYFGTPIRALGIKLSVRGNVSYNRSILFVNSIKNNMDRFNNSINLSLENRNQDVVQASIGARVSHSITKYSTMKSLNQEYLTTAYYTEVLVDFLKTWTVSTKFELTQYTGDLFTDNPQLPIWRAYVSKRFLKSDKGLLKFAVFDILDQNVGINRSSQANYIEDERVTTLSRYFMLSFTYKIMRFG